MSDQIIFLNALTGILTIAKNSKFEFISGPISMGDIVTAEYLHSYELEGAPKADHNVSIFVFKNNENKKWLAYIHQN